MPHAPPGNRTGASKPGGGDAEPEYPSTLPPPSRGTSKCCVGFAGSDGGFDVAGWSKSPSFRRSHKSMAASHSRMQVTESWFVHICRIEAQTSAEYFVGRGEAGTAEHQDRF